MQKLTLKNERLKPSGTSHVTGVVIPNRNPHVLPHERTLVILEFWNSDYSGTITEIFDADELRPATWRERLESSRDTVQGYFERLETALNDAYVVPNCLLPENYHENRSNDGQSFTELTARMAVNVTSTKKLSEKEDREERVELYAGQIAAGQEIKYRPFAENRIDDLNPELAHLFGVGEQEENEEEAYAETL